MSHHGECDIDPKARSCAGVHTTNGNGPTCTWRARRIARLVPSRKPASGNLPPAWSEAPFLQCHHISLGLFKSPGAQPEHPVPTGAISAADHRRRNLRFPGSVGMGQIPPAGAVEDGLRGLHGGAGPQRAEDGTEIGARCWAARSSGARGRHCCEHRARRGRCGG